ncbi:MAG: endonuclease MutS2, partial [Bacteroidota bacterium]
LPADEQTRIPLFHRLMVDIGDQQSIEEDLSTFSSHVSNLRQMLDVADSNTLILIDEAGTGTDPDEGGALAKATLKRLNDRGARTIATTHHGTLKAFAHEEPGVENGSMEFDRETLSPTYRFMPAVPGSSYAFEIARRTGLQDDVLELARELAGRRTSGLEELIGEFEARNQELEKSLIETRSLRAEAERERDLYGERRRKLDRERDDIRRKALEEAERIIARANARVERTIREIKEAEAEREATRVAREKLERFRKELDEVPPSKEPASEITEDAPEPVAGTISVGDQVVIDSGKTVAEVLEDLEREAVVALGSMRMRVAKKRLTKVGGPRKQQVTVRQVASSDAGLSAATARNRIDVRGLRVEGALIEVQRLIDEALQTGQKRVEILHGKGTGALRQAIHESLAESPEVASFDDAPWTEGGAGVTYVTLT